MRRPTVEAFTFNALAAPESEPADHKARKVWRSSQRWAVVDFGHALHYCRGVLRKSIFHCGNAARRMHSFTPAKEIAMFNLNPTQSSDIHVVIGAGQIGKELARVLGEAGYSVRVIRRGPAGAAMKGVQWLQGDIKDRDFADRACHGASIVYNCANPTDYHKWGTTLDPLFSSILEAVCRAKANLVMLDNLYMYGAPDGKLTEESPMNPCSQKGELRKAIAEKVLQAPSRWQAPSSGGPSCRFFWPANVAIDLRRPAFRSAGCRKSH